MTEILSKMQSNHEKSLFKPLFKVTCTSMSVHNGFMLWTLIFFNFYRYVFGEQVSVPAHLFSYADFTVGIYSTSTPFRVLAL